MSKSRRPPVLCFVGISGCGKTTLVARVIEECCKRGLRVGALKHASHGFDLDRPGKDTDRFRQSGAYAIGIASDHEMAVIASTPRPLSLAQLVDALPSGLDLVLCEGFSSDEAIKIGVHRDESPLPAGVLGLVAIVGQGAPYPLLPVFDCSDVDGICTFVLDACGIASEGYQIVPAAAASDG